MTDASTYLERSNRDSTTDLYIMTGLLKITLHYITFNHLADAFIQSDVQMRRTIEAIRPSREQQYTSAMTSLR